jgi:hypothetical protein
MIKNDEVWNFFLNLSAIIDIWMSGPIKRQNLQTNVATYLEFCFKVLKQLYWKHKHYNLVHYTELIKNLNLNNKSLRFGKQQSQKLTFKCDDKRNTRFQQILDENYLQIKFHTGTG